MTSLAAAFAEAFDRCIALDAPLAGQLAAFAGEVQTLSPVFAEAVDALVERLERSEVGASSPKPGEPMPPFALPDEHGRLVELDDLLPRGPTVVIFHRGHWCPYCRISSIAFARAQPAIEAQGGNMVAILPDRQPYAGSLRALAGSSFPFLTDIDNGYALSLNLVFWVGDEMSRLIAAAGIEVPQYQGNPSWMLPVPAIFVVGRDGRVAARFLDPDYRKRVAIDDLVGAVAKAA